MLLDGSRGALVYSREAHSPRGSTPAYRAAGWLAGAPAQQQYRVLSAGLSPQGKQAALLVQGASSTAGSSALKVFAADGFGHWSEVCSIPVQGPVEQPGGLCLHSLDHWQQRLPRHVHVARQKPLHVRWLIQQRSPHTSPMFCLSCVLLRPAGIPQLSAFAGGVHVSVTLGGAQMVYAVGLDGGAATHCPSQPVLTTVQAASGQTSPAASSRTVPTSQARRRFVATE